MALLNPVIMDSMVGVSTLEKIRVILLYLMSQNGVSQEKLGKLIQHGNIEAEFEPMIMNLQKLGINVIAKTQNNQTQVPRKYKRQETFNVFARWTPTVKDLMEEIIDDKLDKSNYPFLPGRAPATGAGVKSHIVSARYGHWHEAGPGNTKPASTRNVPKLIVFIAGGITFSEMRSAYEISEEKNWEVIIGSSHVITPNGFLRDLKDLMPTSDSAASA
jgi:syntaxin-binding protein 1